MPMKIRITIPTQSLDYVKDTISLVNAVTGASISYSTSDDGLCSTAVIQQDDFSTIVYVANRGTGVDLDYTIADWEADTKASHSTYLTNNEWDRYLDHHVGVEILDGDNCGYNLERVAKLIEDNGNFSYSMRVSGTSPIGTHFYIGTTGLRAWEFNLYECDYSSTYPDVCGCIEENRNDMYYVNGVEETC
jgi:hypothetical protein